MRSPLLAGILLVSIILAGVLGAFFLLRGVGATAPIDSLPADTSFLVRVGNPATLWRDLARLRSASADDEVMHALAQELTRRLAERGLPVPPPTADLLRVFDREVILAVVPGEPNAPAGLALVADLGLAGPEAEQRMRRIVQSSFPSESPSIWIARVHHGRDYLTLRPAGGGGGVSVAGLKGLGLVATNGATLRRLLDTIDGRAGPLRSSSAYRATRDRLGRRAGVLAWASGPWIVDRLEGSFTSARTRRALRLMGMGSVRGVGVEIDLERPTPGVPGMFRERQFVAMRDERRGVTEQLLSGPARKPHLSRLVPAGLPFHLVLSCSGLDVLSARLPEIVSSATGADRAELRSRIAGAQEFMAMDLGSGLLAAMGDELVVGFGRASPYPRGPEETSALDMPVVGAIGVRNRASVSRVMTRLDGLARALSAYESIVRDGQAMTAYRLDALAPLTPAYRLGGGSLVAASSPELLATALNAAQRHGSQADQPEAERLLERLPDRSHALLVADTARLAAPVAARALLPAALRFLVQPPGGFPLTAATARMTSTGLQLDWISPLSPSLLLGLYLTSEEPSGAGVPEGAATDDTAIPY